MLKYSQIRSGIRSICGLLLLAVVYSCANIGTPNGGPYDELPPKYVRSTPAPNQTNFKGKKIEIIFDELIQIENPSENVIITPPQRELPVIRAAGKKAVVELKDTLQQNTTYTIDFTNSIADNNEKNVFENFSFAFSTGENIDSLEVAGILLNASNLEPMPGITVGLHKNLEDSAFVKLPFSRTSRTNDKGEFTIRNIAPGTYRVYALNDVNRDYKFDQPGEDIAFLDSLVVPTFELATRQDTVWKDTITVDTIKTVEYTHFMPDNLELLLFKEDFVRQYFQKSERQDEKFFTLHFAAPLDTIPVPVPLNFEVQDSTWYFEQLIEDGAGVNYWMTDSNVWKQDTLMVQVTYPKSDSLNVLRPQTDTMTLINRRRPQPKKKKRRKKEEKVQIQYLNLTAEASGSINLFDTLSVTFSEPVINLDKKMFRLEQKKDTLWNPVDFIFFPDTTNSLKYYISRKWNYGEGYKLTIDSAAITSIYGKWNNKYSSEFSIKKEEEYGHLYLNIVGVDSCAFVELLSSSGEPVRKASLKDHGVLFMDLKPDKYYARIVLDTNNNGKWDTGNYAEKRQPEKVFYSPKLYEIMQNWKVEETWDVYATPLKKQKPLEITKNKPKENIKKKRNYKEEGNAKSSGKSINSMGGLPF